MGKVAVVAAIIGLVSASTAVDAEEPAKGSIDAGRAVALKICAACHVVSPIQQFEPILRPAAPGFRAIANRPRTTSTSLRTFLSTTHQTVRNPDHMPNPQLSDDQITDVVSYILILRDRR